MKTSQLGQILFSQTAPQESKIVSDLIFNALIKARKHERHDVEQFAFYSKIETHEIYAFLNDGNFEIERFGCTINNMWIKLKPTKKQCDFMKELLEENRSDVLKLEKHENS